MTFAHPVLLAVGLLVAAALAWAAVAVARRRAAALASAGVGGRAARGRARLRRHLADHRGHRRARLSRAPARR